MLETLSVNSFFSCAFTPPFFPIPIHSKLPRQHRTLPAVSSRNSSPIRKVIFPSIANESGQWNPQISSVTSNRNMPVQPIGRATSNDKANSLTFGFCVCGFGDGDCHKQTEILTLIAAKLLILLFLSSVSLYTFAGCLRILKD